MAFPTNRSGSEISESSWIKEKTALDKHAEIVAKFVGGDRDHILVPNLSFKLRDCAADAGF